MYNLSGLVFFGCLALGYGFFFGGAQNSLLGMSGGSGMPGMGGGGDMFAGLFGTGGGAGMGGGVDMGGGAGMGGGGPGMGGGGPGMGRGAGMGGMGAGGNSMASMMHSLSRMSLCGETPSRIRYKTRGSCSPYECNRMSTGYDVACLGHSCCCKTFQCTVLLDARK